MLKVKSSKYHIKVRPSKSLLFIAFLWDREHLKGLNLSRATLQILLLQTPHIPLLLLLLFLLSCLGFEEEFNTFSKSLPLLLNPWITLFPLISLSFAEVWYPLPQVVRARWYPTPSISTPFSEVHAPSSSTPLCISLIILYFVQLFPAKSTLTDSVVLQGISFHSIKW